MHRTGRDYGSVADGPFAPLYPYYARIMIERTGIASGHLLDVGSNQGNLGFAAWEQGNFSQITLLDPNERALAKAAAIAAERGIDNCYTLCCGVEAIDLPDESVDLAISRGSMPFWDDQEAAIYELYRVLKPEGAAYIGGGIGTRSMAAAITERMLENGMGEPFYNHQRGSKSLPDWEYARIFADLGCSYAIIKSCDEGHWLMFSKKPSR